MENLNLEQIALRHIDTFPLHKTFDKLGIRRINDWDEFAVFESPFNTDKYGSPYDLSIDKDHNEFTEHITRLHGRPIDFYTRYFNLSVTQVVHRYLERASRLN